jgi:hypothetical protein
MCMRVGTATHPDTTNHLCLHDMVCVTGGTAVLHLVKRALTMFDMHPSQSVLAFHCDTTVAGRRFVEQRSRQGFIPGGEPCPLCVPCVSGG